MVPYNTRHCFLTICSIDSQVSDNLCNSPYLLSDKSACIAGAIQTVSKSVGPTYPRIHEITKLIRNLLDGANQELTGAPWIQAHQNLNPTWSKTQEMSVRPQLVMFWVPQELC